MSNGSYNFTSTDGNLPVSTRNTSYIKPLMERTTDMSELAANNKETDEELKSWHHWIGQRVCISGVKTGILRYFGTTHFAEGIWCGVELDEPVGKNNGSVKDIQYFTCKEDHGIFAPISKTVKTTSIPLSCTEISDKYLTKGTKLKSKLPSPKIKRKNTFSDQNGLQKRFVEMTLSDVPEPHVYNYHKSNEKLDFKPNTGNNILPKARRLSESFDILKKSALPTFGYSGKNVFFEFNNCKKQERKTSLPFNISYTIPTNAKEGILEERSDIFNQTVTLDGDMDDFIQPTDSKHNATFSFVRNDCVLNTTMDSNALRRLSKNSDNDDDREKLENTFILGKSISKACEIPVEKPLEKFFGSEDDLASEFDESLGILSPNQMKDFTLFDQAFSVTDSKHFAIPKMESCDDINELPDFEENKPHSVFSPSKEKQHLQEENLLSSIEDILGIKVSEEIIATSHQMQKNIVKQNINNDDELKNNKVETKFFFSDSPHFEEKNFDDVPANTSTPSGPFKSSVFHPLEHLHFVLGKEKKNINFDFSDISSPLSGEHLTNAGFNMSALDSELQSTPKLSSSLASNRFVVNDLNTFKTGLSKSPDIPNQSASNAFGYKIDACPILDETIANVTFDGSTLDKELQSTPNIIHNLCPPVEQNVLNVTSSTLTKSSDLSQLLSEDHAILNITLESVGSKLSDNFNMPKIETFQKQVEDLLYEKDFALNSNCGTSRSPEKVINVVKSEDFPNVQLIDMELNETNHKPCDADILNCKVTYQQTSSKLDFNADEIEQMETMQDFNNVTILPECVIQRLNTVAPPPKNNCDTSAAQCAVQDLNSTICVIGSDNTEQTASKYPPYQGTALNNSFNEMNSNGSNRFGNNKIKFHISESNCDILNKKQKFDETFSEVISTPANCYENSLKNLETAPDKLNATFSYESISKLVERELNDVDPSVNECNEKYLQDCGESEICKTVSRANESFIISPGELNATFECKDDLLISENAMCQSKNSAPVQSDSKDVNVTICLSENSRHDLTFALEDVCSGNEEIAKGKKSISSKAFPNRKSFWSKTAISAKTTESKQMTDNKNLPPKPPKTNVVSKIKQMLELNKNSGVNQENVSSKNTVPSQKKVGKWDAVTSKITAGLAVERTKVKQKKDVPSKINTNLTAARQVKISPRPSLRTNKLTEKNPKPTIVDVAATKNGKNALNNQRIEDEKLNGALEESNASQGSRILVQLQNVQYPPGKTNDGFKAPFLQPPRTKKGGLFSNAPSELPSPADSSSSSSQVSNGSSKIAVVQKKRMSSRHSYAPLSKNSQNAEVNATKVSTRPMTSLKTARFSVGGKPVESSEKEATLKDNKATLNRSLQNTTPSSRSANPSKPQARLLNAQRDSRSGNSPKWSVSPMLKTSIQRTEPKKFVSKTELVKEIQQLGALCESRTKELTLLKIQLRQATLGFEALAIINKHMVEELDPFSQPRLTREYKRALEELENAGTQLQLYQIQLEELKKIHGDELIELAEKLGIVHTDEINELKLKHNAELAEVDSHHRQQIKNLKEIFQKESEDNDEQNSKLFKELQEDCQKQKEDLEDTHAKKLFEINRQHEEIQAELYNQLRELRLQYEMLQRQVKEAEEAFLKDKNSKIQYISSKKVELEKEVDSLKAVLEMKSSQIHDLNKQKFQMLKELEELPIAKEKIKKLETKTEDLRAMMQAKVQKQRELSSENQQLLMSFEKETRDNTRLSMANEELEWRLRYSKEASLRSTSLSGSPELYDSLYNPLENDRSSSRMSLPTLQSEKQRSSPADVLNNPLMTSSMPLPQSDDRPIGRCHSMSVSWHPVLPTHNETSSPNGPTPHRQRSRSTKVFRASFQSPSKISSYKLKKDIEAEFLRRNSLGPKSQFLSSKLSRPQLCKDVNQPMSMSWGGESIADYYEDLDDNYVQIFTPRHQNTGREKHRVTLKPGSTADKNNKGDVSVNNSSHKCSGNLNDDLCNYTYKGVAQKTIDLAENSIQNGLEADMMEVDRSLAGVNSLQSSFTSSTDSSGSFLPTQTGSEDSSCSTKSHEADSNNQSDRNGNNPIYDLGSYVKSPRNLAGEAMVQDVDSLTHIPSQVFSGETSVEQNGQTKLVNCFFDCDLSSSPEEGKEKATNVVSVGTPSMETSSQGMADSTNIDISWGDDEMPSEYDS